MKKILSLAVIAMTAKVPLLAQTKWGGAFTVKVSMEASQDSVGLFYYDMLQKKQISERRPLQNGTAVFEGNIGEPVFATIYTGPDFKKASQENSLRVYLQAGTISVKGRQLLKDAVLTGSTITDDFAASEAEISPYRKLIAALSADAGKFREQKDSLHLAAVKKKIDSLNTRLKLGVIPAVVKKYRSSPAGAYQLNNLLYNNYGGEMDTTVIIPLYDQLSPEVRELSTAKYIDIRISRARKAQQMTGQAAPDFARLDINGKQIHLSDFIGKYVLIDFWGSWCHPCRKSHPHLKELYAKYKDKGLEIIGVDQELQGDMAAMKKKWQDAVSEDGLTWVQVLNAEGIKDFDIVQGYAIEAFPTKILLDKQGHVVDRFVGDSPNVIEARLDQLLGK